MYLLLASILAGYVFGLVEQLSWLTSKATIGGALFSALFVSVPALAMGGITLPFAALLTGRPFCLRAIERWRQLTSRANDQERERVVRHQARIFSSLLLLAVIPFLFGKALKYLWSLQDSEIAIDLAVGLVAATAAAATAGWLGLTRLMRWPLARLDRRVRLPLPPQPELRILLFFSLPVIAVVAPFSARNRDTLGFLTTGLNLVMVAVCVLPFVSLLTRLRAHCSAYYRLFSAGIVALWVLSLGGGILAYDRYPNAGRAGESGPVASLGAKWLRFLSDFDRDLSPSILGGADCAPFDRARGPRALDIAGNGVDENCDGHDAVKSLNPRAGADLQLFYGGLSRDQIKKYNIVWVILEAIRADHMGALGYRVPTTPNIDALAAKSWLFSNAYSQS